MPQLHNQPTLNSSGGRNGTIRFDDIEKLTIEGHPEYSGWSLAIEVTQTRSTSSPK
jgi:hypothetical protein